MENLNTLRDESLTAVATAETLEALEVVRISVLGRKGRVTELMKGLGQVEADRRRETGQELNAVKDVIATAIESRVQTLQVMALGAQVQEEAVDVSLPSRPESAGRLHPISQTFDEIVAIFGEMGFVVAQGPDIEDDFYNFTALNIPPEHPARQMHDTFYLQTLGAAKDTENGEMSTDGRRLLRTHTSPVQIRTMLAGKPPFRIIAPGRTYRCDSDITHTPMFHQVEGLVVDTTTHMGHLKGCLIDFCRTYFETPDVPVRFRPSHFPFTEPSAEVDIGCSRAGGQLKIGAGDDWLEILGCGMVHPKVLEAGGVDSSKYQGFAFGIGLERIAMLKYGIPDLRTFFDADIRWLRHYGFVPLEVPTLLRGLTL
jgi:phenylalanyl-tRNA synthetase alpha chain